jgi:hypothetical protein
LLVHGGDVRVDVGRGHPDARALAGVTERRKHDVVRGLHEGELGRRFDHSLRPDDRVGADDADTGQLLFQPIHDPVAVGFLEGDRAVGDPPLVQEVGHQSQRLLILVPGADFGGHLEHLGDARPLEERGDDDRVAFGGDDRGGEALAPPPLNPGVIIEARAGLDEDGADSAGAHQLLSPGKPLHALGAADRRRDRDRRDRLRGRGQHLRPRYRQGRSECARAGEDSASR